MNYFFTLFTFFINFLQISNYNVPPVHIKDNNIQAYQQSIYLTYISPDGPTPTNNMSITFSSSFSTPPKIIYSFSAMESNLLSNIGQNFLSNEGFELFSSKLTVYSVTIEIAQYGANVLSSLQFSLLSVSK
jgi:hypothetical protein